MSQSFGRPASDFLKAEFAMNLGRGFMLVAFTLQLFRASGDIWHNLIYVASDALFAFLIPLVAGSWIDRHGPGPLVYRSTIAASLVVAVFAASIQLWGLHPDGMLLVSVVVGVLNAGVRVGVFALTPSLVQSNSLANMNGRQQIAFQAGHLCGVLAAGTLLDRVGFSACLVAVAASMAVAGSFYWRASVGLVLVAPMRGYSGSLLAGFARMLRPVVTSPMMIWIIVLGAGDLIVVALFNLALPLLVERQLGGSSLAVSAAGVSFALGSILLGLVVTRADLEIHQLHKALILMPVLAFATIVQLQFFHAYVYFALVFALGFATALHTVYFTTTVQALVEPSLRGRFAAIRRMTSATLVGSCSYAFAAAYAGMQIPGALLAAGTVCLALALGCLAWVILRADEARTTHVDLKSEFVRISDNLSLIPKSLEPR